MIKIDPNKKKNLSFSVNVEGIEPQLLEYNLRLSSGNIDYGFKGQNNNGEISFSLPPLKEVVNQDNISNISTIKLEVHDKNNKYYLKPFEDQVKIDKQLKNVKVVSWLTPDDIWEYMGIKETDAVIDKLIKGCTLSKSRVLKITNKEAAPKKAVTILGDLKISASLFVNKVLILQTPPAKI